jgi:DNA-binding MarR family transcriptional regulator
VGVNHGYSGPAGRKYCDGVNDARNDADPSVAEIEHATFQLRRLWAKPQLLQQLREHCEEGRSLQLSNLMVIHAVASQGDDVTVGAVADYLDIDPSTASRLVGHAIDAGFVSRRASPVDARRKQLQLTDAGWRIKELTDEFRRQFIAELVADWSDEERETFARLLGRFCDAAANLPIERVSEFLQAAQDPDT